MYNDAFHFVKIKKQWQKIDQAVLKRGAQFSQIWNCLMCIARWKHSESSQNPYSSNKILKNISNFKDELEYMPLKIELCT